MIKIVNKENCCGCASCAQICPKKCITMNYDNEGFSYPSVNAEMCIECGLCDTVCPVKNSEQKGESVLAAYAAYANDDNIRLLSSSGGLFYVIAESVILDGGVVFGVILDENRKTSHVMATTIDELNKMRGSKYLQSDIKNSFVETKRVLRQGRRVLYTGTSCQIAGLKRFLHTEYDNLMTIDILCHGVTSQKLWKSYLSTYKDEVLSASFRSKESGWKNYSMQIDFKNKNYKVVHGKDPYMKIFLSDICLRPSCYQCKFKSLDRDSDITLGDAWGIGKILPDMDDDKGTSVVIVHSEKGNKLLNEVKDQIVIKEDEVDRLLPPTADSRKSVKPHRNRKKYLEMISNNEYSFINIEKLTRRGFIRRILSKCKNIIRK